MRYFEKQAEEWEKLEPFKAKQLLLKYMDLMDIYVKRFPRRPGKRAMKYKVIPKDLK